MALEKIRATIVPELVTMDLTVVIMVLVLETTAHPIDMALQTLETTGVSPVTTALEPTSIPPPRLVTMGAILALGLVTMAQELEATALVVMAPRPEPLAAILATMAPEVINIPLPRLEVTVLKVETMAVTPVAILATMAPEVINIPLPRLEVTVLKVETMAVTPVAILATMVLGLETMDLAVTLGLEAMALKLETMAATLAIMALGQGLGQGAMALDLATTVLEVTIMHLAAMVQATLATILRKLETTAVILAITGTATVHRLAVEPVTVPTWQTNWTPG